MEYRYFFKKWPSDNTWAPEEWRWWESCVRYFLVKIIALPVWKLYSTVVLFLTIQINRHTYNMCTLYTYIYMYYRYRIRNDDYRFSSGRLLLRHRRLDVFLLGQLFFVTSSRDLTVGELWSVDIIVIGSSGVPGNSLRERGCECGENNKFSCTVSNFASDDPGRRAIRDTVRELDPLKPYKKTWGFCTRSGIFNFYTRNRFLSHNNNK